MNRLTKQCLAFLLGMIAFLFLLGLGGRQDYTEQVVYTMPQKAYERIVLQLGDGASKYDIVNEYQSNRKYYDSLFW